MDEFEDDSPEPNLFIVMWCCEGLECIINVTDKLKATMFDTLKGGDGVRKELGSLLFRLTIRAQANIQRAYEIYTINMDAEITEEDIRAMFEDSPQCIVDLIRERGHKVYSDRRKAPPVIV